MADEQPSNPVPPASGFPTIGNELDPTAPLYTVYRDETRKHDKDVLGEWNKMLSILLIVAGLFSAVVTSFLVASYPLLAPRDQNEAVVNAIHALAMAINSSITLPTPQPPDPVTASAVWVNGLWFTSLFLALAVAFLAILAKQWLIEYNHRMSDTAATISLRRTPLPTFLPTYLPDNDDPPPPPPQLDPLSPTGSRAWARQRQCCFAAITDWHIPLLITQVLPFLLHVALFFFFIGLSILVSTLNRRIARAISALTALLFCLYLMATVWPVFRAQCPTATPLVRRAHEVPTWIAIKVVQVWSILLIALRSFGLSCLASLDFRSTLAHLRQRQKHIRDSVLRESAGTTDGEVELDTLQWLILASGSETGITAAFQAVGALPPNSPFLPSLREITGGMDTAVERLGHSPVPSTAVAIIRAVRSELVLGRGSWDLPLLGLDLSSSFIQTLRESQHPDARLLSAAMHLDGTRYVSQLRRGTVRSFSSLYDITDTLLRGEASASCISTARLLLDRPGIPPPAFACLSVLLIPSLHLDESDKALIFRVFKLLCKPYHISALPPHTCDEMCVADFMVCNLDEDDPASHRIVPIIISHLLPALKSVSNMMAEDSVLRTILNGRDFCEAISRSDWLHSPRPVGNTDVEVLSTLMSRFDWSYQWAKDAYMQIFTWFMSRAQYGILQSPSLIEKLLETRTCDPDKRPSMLQDFCDIVHRVKPNGNERLSYRDEVSVYPFISSLISLCRDLSPYSDPKTRDVLFRSGLLPEIGACLERLGPTLGPNALDIRSETCKYLFDTVNTALRSLDGHVETKEEYLLHLAQHCIVLDPEWTRREEVGAHLDARLLEELLVREGPCTKCSEGSVDKWPSNFLALVHDMSPIIGQDPQPDASALPSRRAASSTYARDVPAATV